MDRADRARDRMDALAGGDEVKALGILEQVAALHPPVVAALRGQWEALKQGLPSCAKPSATSIRDELGRKPLHQCGLAFANYREFLEQAESAEARVREQLDGAIGQKMAVLLSPAVQKRLEQGRAEPFIRDLLACTSPGELWGYLMKACLDEPGVVTLINRYLKRIAVKRVKIDAFHPTLSTVERGQIDQLAKEFADYLEGELRSIAADDEDTLPILQLE